MTPRDQRSHSGPSVRAGSKGGGGVAGWVGMSAWLQGGAGPAQSRTQRRASPACWPRYSQHFCNTSGACTTQQQQAAAGRVCEWVSWMTGCVHRGTLGTAAPPPRPPLQAPPNSPQPPPALAHATHHIVGAADELRKLLPGLEVVAQPKVTGLQVGGVGLCVGKKMRGRGGRCGMGSGIAAPPHTAQRAHRLSAESSRA